ncbi:centrosomal protein of 152 kDa [Amia ocellicauda]|uniref:centrosomal protein of 152 kDa n=1 Tax=Amia ocellicauda TaxID=2972642 RepID=UPI0034641E1F
MSIDFDSAALQTQHEEEEFDREDYAREQELHKLLTDLPDDMLEDSRDVSSPELNYSGNGNGNRPPQAWEQEANWNSDQGVITTEQGYEPGYSQEQYHGEYAYGDESEQFNGHDSLLHDAHPRVWTEPHAEGHEYMYDQRGFGYPSIEAEDTTGSKEYTAEEQYGQSPYHQTNAYHLHAPYSPSEGQREDLSHGDQHNRRDHFQKFQPEGSADTAADGYEVRYKPYPPPAQPGTFSADVRSIDGQYDPLQRELLDSGDGSTDHQQIAQLQIFNKARLRQIENLEQELEDCRRNMRYLKHQFAIVKDEKEGLTLSLQESGKIIKDLKEKEMQLEGKIKALEIQVQALIANNEENVKKQKIADAAVDSMKQQMAELCRSDTLTRAREEHGRVLAAVNEKHEERVLAFQQKLDAQSHALEEQSELCQRLQEHVKQLERQQEDRKIENAEKINRLTKSLEESQQQCSNLLQTGTVQEMNQLRILLQQALSAKNIGDSMIKSLQEELSDMKEQITLFESAATFGVLAMDPSGELENQMTDSYVELGIKKINWKNSTFHSTFLAGGRDKNMSKEDLIIELKTELGRFLSSLKVKRKKISQLQDELKQSHTQVQELKSQLEKADKDVRDSMVRENSLEKHLGSLGVAAAGQVELERLQKESQYLQEQLEQLGKQNTELKCSEEKMKSANLELCTEMRNMIQVYDQEKQELVERYERTHQQHRDDIVSHLRAELSQDHATEMENLTKMYEDKIQVLETQIADLNKEMVGVQECYVTVCKEKDTVAEDIRCKIEKEMHSKEEELKKQLTEDKEQALEKLKVSLEDQHRVALATARAMWVREKETDVKQQVDTQVSLARMAWQEEQHKVIDEAVQKVEKEWAQRLEKAVKQMKLKISTHERHCQTESPAPPGDLGKELESQLAAQKLKMQQEAAECQVRAVEEAIKKTRKDLENKRVEDIAKEVESAVSSAYSRWLLELNALPEYKASLQAEREKWEREHEQDVAKQISTVLKAAEERWKKSHQKELEKLEAGSRNTDLQEKVVSLQRQLEHREEAEAALVKAELARARAAWNKDKQEEMNHIQQLNAEDYRSFLEEHRNKLNEVVQLAKEGFERQKTELLLQKEAEFHQLLQEKEEEWHASQEQRLQAEKQLYEERVVAEIQVLLEEIQQLLLKDPNKQPLRLENQCNSPKQTRRQCIGKLKACLQAACRDLVSRAINEAKEEWKKSSDVKLCASKEEEDRHEQDIKQLRSQSHDKKNTPSCGRHCVEKLAKSQKQCQDLQRHLEKACRQLQQTVRENKANVQRLREEYEETLTKEKDETMKRIEEIKSSESKASVQSHGASSHEDRGQLCVQAGLEEMREQYMNAVAKIRGDMLRYIQESKARAAEMIRVEVLRERQDTARKMRKYYLTCLQELLEDGGKREGAEKKIINAASKLAAMAKVLETPVPKRKFSKTSAAPGSTKIERTAVNQKPVEVFCAPLGQNPKHSASSSHVRNQEVLEEQWRDHTIACNSLRTSEDKTHEDVSNVPKNELPKGTQHSGEVLGQDVPAVLTQLWNGKRKKHSGSIPQHSSVVGEAARNPVLNPALPPSDSCFGRVSPFTLGNTFCDTAPGNVTIRKQSRELYLKGRGQAEECFTTESMSIPFLIQETPVRDEGGPSDWSSASLGAHSQGQNHLALYPGSKADSTVNFPFQALSVVSSLSDTSDDYMYDFRRKAEVESGVATSKEGPGVFSKPKTNSGSAGLHVERDQTREHVPGSEGERRHRFCSKNLFSEVKAPQQDSGFDSPLYAFQK